MTKIAALSCVFFGLFMACPILHKRAILPAETNATFIVFGCYLQRV